MPEQRARDLDAANRRARDLDAADPLAGLRSEFYVPEGVIYLDGNSLGLASRPAEAALRQAFDAWRDHGIGGWTTGDEPWFTLSERLGAMMAPLVGGEADEVVATGSITLNLHALVATFYRPNGRRTRILSNALEFPTDVYALQSQLALRGRPRDDLLLVPSDDGRTLDEARIVEAMDDSIALALLPSVLYRSGQLLDVARLTAEAQARGIVVGLDIAHSIGAMPHALHDWGVDFAVWCTYKHLNAGPGAVGGLFVHRRHHGLYPALAGWFGSDKQAQFDMALEMQPAADAGAFQTGTPHIFSAAPLLGSLALTQAAGLARIREKSLRLTDWLLELADRQLAEFGFRVGTPREHERRGGHVSLEHPDAARIARALRARRVIPDFRAPDGIRLAPVALYTSFGDVVEAVWRLRAIMTDREYEAFENRRDLVA
jgi:kynureninase